jgi:hypothetical protein
MTGQYEKFSYYDDRYPRIASNPTDNRKPAHRIRYDATAELGGPRKYGLIRPRVLMRTMGNLKPERLVKFAVRASYSGLCRPFEIIDTNYRNM